MSRLLKIGRVFSRDCFLVFGGAMVLIALGGVAGNLRDIINYRDWPDLGLNQIVNTALLLAGLGSVFLLGAYAQFRSDRWGPCIAAMISFVWVVWIIVPALAEPESGYFPFRALLIAMPMALALVWAVAEAAQGFKARRPVETT